jgi:hypothetical protein
MRGNEIALKVFGFSCFTYFYTNNTYITSKFIVLYMSDLNFIIVAWLFNVCCISEVKIAPNNGDFTAKECRAVMKYLFLQRNSDKKNLRLYVGYIRW